MKRILKVLTYVAAGLYLLVDAIFMTIAKPIASWIDKHVPLKRLRDWIRSLPPYPSLALFSVPVIVLEPIKPIAAYLAGTGQFLIAAVAFIFGELLTWLKATEAWRTLESLARSSREYFRTTIAGLAHWLYQYRQRKDGRLRPALRDYFRHKSRNTGSKGMSV